MLTAAEELEISRDLLGTFSLSATMSTELPEGDLTSLMDRSSHPDVQISQRGQLQEEWLGDQQVSCAADQTQTAGMRSGSPELSLADVQSQLEQLRAARTQQPPSHARSDVYSDDSDDASSHADGILAEIENEFGSPEVSIQQELHDAQEPHDARAEVTPTIHILSAHTLSQSAEKHISLSCLSHICVENTCIFSRFFYTNIRLLVSLNQRAAGDIRCRIGL